VSKEDEEKQPVALCLTWGDELVAFSVLGVQAWVTLHNARGTFLNREWHIFIMV
jgi:hypothetical protein